MKPISLVLAALFCAASVPVSFAAMEPGETGWVGSEPPTGIYFKWYEPSFYAGFAPRTQDPSRLHIELSRGNQLRVTMVLGDAELDNYLSDLDARRAIYQELVDRKILQLTTNKEYERFVAGLDREGVTAALSSRASLGADGWRKKSVDVLAALNPGRVYRLHLPVERLAADWHARLASLDPASPVAKLDAANAVLPGRVSLYELAAPVAAALDRAVSVAKANDAASPAFRAETEAFLAAATSGRYRAANGFVDAVEFTAIYPAGTVDALTTAGGEKIPDFGVTGVWPLIRREQGKGQTGMVDYLSTNPGYGYIPMFAYQHAAGIAYNAFHNAGIRSQLNSTPILPPEWRKAVSDRDGKPMVNLWVVGRGPTSHGCTRLPSGHMSELRHVAPSESDTLTKVVHFRNLPQCYDVFDVDGDGRDEAMGVQYYLAYKSDERTRAPSKTSVSNRREPFYRWMYGANIELGPVGQAKIKRAPVCRFVGLRKAQEKGAVSDVPLFEAPYEREAIQFYTIKGAASDSAPGFHFNRELRKVGAGHQTDRKLLMLN
jgi:hypothetical protein